MGPDSRFGSFGFCFGPSGQFSTHFGPVLMILGRPRTLVSQDWTWADLADFGRPMHGCCVGGWFGWPTQAACDWNLS